jgi:oligo-1,6-glucosidase
MRDNGYDISDYETINPEFGTMADFEAMLEKAHSLGLKIIMDLVANHSSDKHPWFIESRSSRSNPKRDYYIWHNGNAGAPPNNWKAWFGGSAWTQDEKTAQYFLHSFSPHQPDLNWENPALRKEIYQMMRRWFDKGIDGFRLDAIGLISKPKDFSGEHITVCANGPRLHEFLREMRREVFSQYNAMTVGEASCVTLEEAIHYANADGSELDMVFHFDHTTMDGDGDAKWNEGCIDFIKLKHIFARWQNGLFGRAWNSLYWCNHDQPRIVSRLGATGTLREKSAKMLAASIHFMQGTPYIYQGEELGMTNAPFSALNDFRDLESLNAYQEFVVEKKTISHDAMLKFLRAKSRDNARTPMQWTDGSAAGFTSGTPWIMVNPNYSEINAQEQMQRSNSVFAFYKTLIKLRKLMDIITLGNFELLEAFDPDLFVYTRRHELEALFVVCNFSHNERTYALPELFSAQNPEVRILLTNETEANIKTGKLEAFGFAVYYTTPRQAA